MATAEIEAQHRADRKAARADIEREGASITLKRTSQGDHDPIAGTYSNDAETEHGMAAVVQDHSWRRLDGQTGPRVETYTLLVACETDDGTELIPANTDKIRMADADWLIHNVTVTDPGGVPIVAELMLRF